MTKLKKVNPLSHFLVFSIGFFILAALPLTGVFLVPNVRLLFFGAVVALFCILLLGGMKIKTGKFIFIISIFFFIVLISYPLSRAPVYGLSKLTHMVGYFLILPLVLINIVKIKKQEETFILGSFFAGLLLIFTAYYYYGSPYELIRAASRFYRFRLGEDGNPILTARYFGLVILVFVFFIFNSKSILLRIIYLFFPAVSLMYMVSTGSKGPSVALIISLLVFVFFGTKNRKTWIFLIMLGLFLVGLLLIAMLSPEFIMERFTSKIDNLSGRLPGLLGTLASITKSNIVELTIGHGLGDFGFYSLGRDERSYPHNLFVELLYELGSIGLVVFIWWMVYPITNFIKVNQYKVDRIGGFIVGVYIFSIINAQFSGDLPANFFIPIFAALLIAHTDVVKRSKSEGRVKVKTSV